MKSPYSDKVRSIQPVHKLPLNFDETGKEDLPERWVVWATMERKDYPGFEGERVWLRTVEDDGDRLPLRQRSLLVKAFFETIVGQEIAFNLKSGEWYQACYSVEDGTLPEMYQVDSFSEIQEWVTKNHPEWLEDGLKVLREKKAKAVAITKKKNAVERKAELEKRRQRAIKLVFSKGRNPKHGTDQWEAHRNGRLYVLAKECKYESSDGEIPVEVAFDLVPDRIILVDRI